MPSHRVLFSKDAEAAYKRLDGRFQWEIALRLTQISEDPIGQSRPSALPYPPGYQFHGFTFVDEGRTHLISLLFLIRDGGVIAVEHIGFVTYGSGPPRGL